MKQNIQSLILPVILAALAILPHLPFFDNGYIDIEPLFVDTASKIVADGFSVDLSYYYSVDGNPITTPLIFAIGYKLFGESPTVSRLTIFILSFAFVLFLFYYLRPKTSPYFAFLTALLVSVNPMFIAYSQYIAADVDFMVFSSIALLLLVFPFSAKSQVVSSIMFGISAATKYAALVIAPAVFIISLLKSRILEGFSRAKLASLLRFNIWYFTLAILLALPVILIVFVFQSSIMPTRGEKAVFLSAGMFIPRLFAYLTWLGLFVGPSALIFGVSLWRRVRKTRFLVLLLGLAAAIFIVSLFFPLHLLVIEREPFGAASLGGIESAVPPLYLSVGIFFVLLAAGIFICHAIVDIKDLWSSREENVKSIIFWGLTPIPLMAVNRVVARYLLFVLVPISWYMAHVAARMYSERNYRAFVIAVLVVHVLVFLAAGLAVNYYFQQRGLAG